MIEKETLFVLGAGASVPYEFPTAKELKDKIISSSAIEYSKLDNSFATMGTGITMYNSFDNDSFNAFTREFLYYTNPSIDLFLATHPDFTNIGKTAIVLALNRDEENYAKKTRKISAINDWMEYLYSNFLINEITSNKKDD